MTYPLEIKRALFFPRFVGAHAILSGPAGGVVSGISFLLLSLGPLLLDL